MKAKYCFVSLVLWLAACSTGATTTGGPKPSTTIFTSRPTATMGTTSNTITLSGLPTPRPFGHLESYRPPLAWLLTPAGAVEASYGPFTTTAHTDPAAQLRKQDIVPVTLRGDNHVIVLINSPSISACQGSVRAWQTDTIDYMMATTHLQVTRAATPTMRLCTLTLRHNRTACAPVRQISGRACARTWNIRRSELPMAHCPY